MEKEKNKVKTLVFLQNSRSLQHDSSTSTSGPLLGSMYTAPIDDVNTTRRSLASAAAMITFFVPSTAGSTISSFKSQPHHEPSILFHKNIKIQKNYNMLTDQ
jgi:hypothetical protein